VVIDGLLRQANDAQCTKPITEKVKALADAPIKVFFSTSLNFNLFVTTQPPIVPRRR
jgi:hypothetical protein